MLNVSLVSKKDSRADKAKKVSKQQNQIARQPRTVKTVKLAQAKKRIRHAKSLMGREIILRIGTMSVLVQFLDVNSRMMLNLICRRVYRIVMPGISGTFLIGSSREFPDWLDWGKDASALSKIKV